MEIGVDTHRDLDKTLRPPTGEQAFGGFRPVFDLTVPQNSPASPTLVQTIIDPSTMTLKIPEVPEIKLPIAKKQMPMPRPRKLTMTQRMRELAKVERLITTDETLNPELKRKLIDDKRQELTEFAAAEAKKRKETEDLKLSKKLEREEKRMQDQKLKEEKKMQKDEKR